jgi:hypothetical protein
MFSMAHTCGQSGLGASRGVPNPYQPVSAWGRLQRSDNTVAFPVKIRRPPGALQESREGKGLDKAVFEQSEEVGSPDYS